MTSGIYALRHKATGALYIGSSRNLKLRRKKWRNALNSRFTHIPLRGLLTTSHHDWEFVVISEVSSGDPEDLIQGECEAVEYLRQRAPDRCLNWLPATRLDVNTITIGDRTQSLRAWMRETGIPRTTLAHRFHAGWTPEQIIGLAPPPAPVGQADPEVTSRVLVFEGDRFLTRSQAALRLGCKPATLTKRLRRFRQLDRQVVVQLRDLQKRPPPAIHPLPTEQSTAT